MTDHERVFHNVAELTRLRGLSAAEALRLLRRWYASIFQGMPDTPEMLRRLSDWEKAVTECDALTPDEHRERLLVFLEGRTGDE